MVLQKVKCRKAGLLVLKACVYWERMETGGCEQLALGPVFKPKARIQLNGQKMGNF